MEKDLYKDEKMYSIMKNFSDSMIQRIKSNSYSEIRNDFIYGNQELLDILLEKISKGGDLSIIRILNVLRECIDDYFKFWDDYIGPYEDIRLIENTEYFCAQIIKKHNNPFLEYKVKRLLQEVKLIDPPRFGRSNLKITNNAEFYGEPNGETVKIALDYASFISDKWYTKEIIASYQWKYDQGNNTIANNAYAFYIFLKKYCDYYSIDGDYGVASKVYLYLNDLYYHILSENADELLEICIQILGKIFGRKLYEIFISSIDTKNNILRKMNNDVESHLINNFFNDWFNVFLQNNVFPPFIKILNSSEFLPQEKNKTTLQGKKYVEILSSSHINIYDFMNINELAIFMQEMHAPEMIYMMNEDLGVDITDLSLQNQVHLFRFLWEKSSQEFEGFKNILEKQEDKYAFFTTFLACSKNPNIGDEILQLAQNPQSTHIFQAYAHLVNLQSEIDEKDVSSVDFLKALLSRGEKLLQEASKDSQNLKELSIDKKYSKELVKSGAFVRALMKHQKLSLQEFNERCPYFYLDFFQGSLFYGESEIDIFSEENFSHNEILNSQGLQDIISWANHTYSGDRKKQDFIRKNLIQNFKNKKTNHLFLKDRFSGEIKGYCKVQGNYFGSLYVNPNFTGDFGLGDLMQNIIIQEANLNKSVIYASAFLGMPILERHINKFQGIGTEIEFTPNGIGCLNFEWNSLINISNISEEINFENTKEFCEICKKYLANDYVITHIHYTSSLGGSVVFTQKKKE